MRVAKRTRFISKLVSGLRISMSIWRVPGFAYYQAWRRTKGQLPIMKFICGRFLYDSELAGHSLVLGHIFRYVCLSRYVNKWSHR